MKPIRTIAFALATVSLAATAWAAPSGFAFLQVPAGARAAAMGGAYMSLAQGADGVRLVIEDDGRGADGEPEPLLGLLGMRERVTQVGGTLHIGRAERGGLRIEVTLPADARRGR